MVIIRHAAIIARMGPNAFRYIREVRVISSNPIDTGITYLYSKEVEPRTNNIKATPVITIVLKNIVNSKIIPNSISANFFILCFLLCTLLNIIFINNCHLLVVWDTN